MEQRWLVATRSKAGLWTAGFVEHDEQVTEAEEAADGLDATGFVAVFLPDHEGTGLPMPFGGPEGCRRPSVAQEADER